MSSLDFVLDGLKTDRRDEAYGRTHDHFEPVMIFRRWWQVDDWGWALKHAQNDTAIIGSTRDREMLMVTEESVRNRAYFLFANRTGSNWQDPVSNWIQAIAEEVEAARATDITGELFTYRPLSQFMPTMILPAIEAKIASGSIASSALPIELQRLQILWPSSGQPIVQINGDVAINVVGTPTRSDYKLDEAIFANDVVPGSERLVPPEVDGKRVAYLLLFSSFMDFRVYFDFTPNGPEGPADSVMPLYELQELATRKAFFQVHPPEVLLARLKQLGWPPSPAYYPSLVHAMSQPGGDTPQSIATTIKAIHGPSYWARRMTLWEELKIFANRTPYVRKAIEEYLEGDYVSSVYVAVPQFEGVINDYVRGAGGTLSGRFRNDVGEFLRLIQSRKALLFPRYALTEIVDFIDSGTFWDNTSTITNQQEDVNRHGIAHGVFTGFETQELALKFIILIDCIALILLQDQVLRGVLN
jgi:hypothetical protein